MDGSEQDRARGRADDGPTEPEFAPLWLGPAVLAAVLVVISIGVMFTG